MIWNRILYRLGTCFHDPFPASSVSVQAVLPPKKGQGDVGLGGTPLGPPAPVGVRRDGPGSAVPPSGLEKQRQWAAGGQVRRACQRAAVAVREGKLKRRERKQQAVSAEKLWGPAFIYNGSS